MQKFPIRCTLMIVAPLLTAPALAQQPAPLDAAVRQMVETAARSGDSAKISAVVAVAKATNPQATAEIDSIVDAIAAERHAAHEAELRHAGYFENWTGSGQLGGALSTGNSNTKSVTAGIALEREGLLWRHRVNALLDLVDSDQGADQERILAGYQLDYQYSERAYVWARLQYERNRQGGIDRRFVEAVGFGWQVFAPSAVSWDLEAGPAVRQTRYPGYSENRIAGRGASRFRWDLSSRAAFTNDTAFFWEKAATVTNTAALTSKLIGSLSAQISYDLAWEQSPPVGRKELDSTTRMTLVYDF